MRDTLIWKAMKEEVEGVWESVSEKPITEKELNKITDEIIHDDYIWQIVNEAIAEKIPY